MRNWQMDRKPTRVQDEEAKDEVFPAWKSSTSTHPRLTLPSVPKASAKLSQRPTMPRQPASSPAPLSPRTPAGWQTGQAAAGSGAERSTAPVRAQPPTSTPARIQTWARVPTPPRDWSAAPPARTLTGKRLPTPSRVWDNEEPLEPTAKTAVTLIPGKYPGARSQRSGLFWQARHSIPARLQALILLCILTALVLGIVLGGVLRGGLELTAFNYSTSPSGSFALPVPTAGPTLPAGVNTTNIDHYITKYGFDPPTNVAPMTAEETQLLRQMMPYAVAATARYDARYQAQVEPEMLLWWTHAEGIDARINYSNCANESPPAGQSYFSSIENCDRPDFWQLGYGNQFGNIWVLKDAFTDMYGNPNDPQLVQKVGQSVLNYDMAQHTVPACGGYSCTFPAMTIDQIMADVHWHASDHKETESYMLALALTSFSHAQTATWVGCYYAEPCWQNESNAMWQILDAWKSLGGS